MSIARSVLLVTANESTARRFLGLLTSDISQRGLAPAGLLTARWRARALYSHEESAISQLRISAPRLSTLPDVDVVAVETAALYAEAERLAGTPRSESVLGPMSAVIYVVAEGEANSTAVVRMLVDVLNVGSNPVDRGRIQASFALAKVPTRESIGCTQQATAEFTETLRLANDMFAAAREFEIPGGREVESVGSDGASAQAAGDIVRWSLTILNPSVLTVGVRGALGRASAPALWSYALALFTLGVLAPHPAFLLIESVCGAIGGVHCSASAALALEEVPAFDPIVVAVALGLAAVVGALVPRALAAMAARRGSRLDGAYSSIRWCIGLVLACWVLLLFPRSVLMLGLDVAHRIGVRIPEHGFALALDAANLRGSAVSLGLVVTLVVLLTEHLRVIRHERELHRIRMGLRGRLTLQQRRQ